MTKWCRIFHQHHCKMSSKKVERVQYYEIVLHGFEKLLKMIKNCIRKVMQYQRKCSRFSGMPVKIKKTSNMPYTDSIIIQKKGTIKL